MHNRKKDSLLLPMTWNAGEQLHNEERAHDNPRKPEHAL